MKRSIIWKPSKEEFQKIVNKCNSIAAISRHFGLATGAPNYKTIKRRIKEDQIDISHIKLGLDSNKGRPSNQKKSAKDYFNKKHVQMSKLKAKLIEENYLKKECSICGQGPVWNNQELVLQLDHINGNREDNSLKNLRLLCPNCHTQTPTWGAKRTKKPKNHCIDCFKVISKLSKRCQSCSSKIKPRIEKISWPNNEELSRLVFEKPLIHLAKDLKVSDNAIRKRCKNNCIKLPPQGYWLTRAPSRVRSEHLQGESLKS